VGVVERDCGECIACCVYPSIDDPELKKDSMTHCPNLTLPGGATPGRVFMAGTKCGNCKIYPTRPKTCGNYTCAWLQGYGDEDDRPDKSLILVDNSKRITNAFEAKPLAPNVESTLEGKATIDRMSASMGVPIIVLNFYERRIKRIAGRGV